CCFFFSSRRRHTRFSRDWSSDVCSSDLFLEVFTDQPGVQLYTGNHLDGTLPIPGGVGNYERRTGFCLETQNFPDAPNQENFPPATLVPGETFTSITTFKFSVKE